MMLDTVVLLCNNFSSSCYQHWVATHVVPASSWQVTAAHNYVSKFTIFQCHFVLDQIIIIIDSEDNLQPLTHYVAALTCKLPIYTDESIQQGKNEFIQGETDISNRTVTQMNAFIYLGFHSNMKMTMKKYEKVSK